MMEWNKYGLLSSMPSSSSSSAFSEKKREVIFDLVGWVGWVALFGMSMWGIGHLFGFAGVLVALPVSAVLAVAVHRLRGMYVESRLYGG